MVFVRIDGENHKIKGYRSFELAPFTNRHFDKKNLNQANMDFYALIANQMNLLVLAKLFACVITAAGN